MLKLINALDMNIYNVIEYKHSYDGIESLEIYDIGYVDTDLQAYKEAIVVNSHYYLVDEENPNYIIGDGEIDNHPSINYHIDNDGNIAYSIRPNERKKGYGTIILSLLLEECINKQMKEISISCFKENIASVKIIKKHNGIFEKEFKERFSKKMCNKYWINLEAEKVKTKLYKE